MILKSGQEKVMVIYGRSLCTLLHAASLSVQCTAMHRSAAWLKGGWEGLLAKNFVCLFVIYYALLNANKLWCTTALIYVDNGHYYTVSRWASDQGSYAKPHATGVPDS